MKTLRTFIVLALVGTFAYTNLFSQGANLVNTVVALTGTVYNDVTKKPVKVKIDILDENNKKVNSTNSNSADGSYYITGLKPGKKYIIKIGNELGASEEFMKEKFDYPVPETKMYTEFTKDFLVKPLGKEVKLHLSVAPFYQGKGQLRSGSQNFVDNMKNALVDNKAVKFVIECYPDNDKDKEFNKKLTEERAKSLKEYFEKSGIDVSRINIKSYDVIDPNNPPPTGKAAKGKKYIGSTYIVIKEYK
jgi:outer membrane protein OmpA-like peptidoglycan-associated protein